jgi:hypothetical protein
MASFWDWRGSSTSVTASAPAVDQVPLERVELYTRQAMVLGRVAPDGQRLSDILNSNSHLPVRDARSISVLNGLEGTDGDGWTPVRTDDILLAMPPERASPRQMRINRRQHRVRIETGPYVVVGTAHVLPGTALDPYVLRSRMRFLALTQVHVTSKSDPSWERTAPVVLVNVRPLSDLTEVVTIA